MRKSYKLAYNSKSNKKNLLEVLNRVIIYYKYNNIIYLCIQYSTLSIYII
jgi:hypothetical protein